MIRNGHFGRKAAIVTVILTATTGAGVAVGVTTTREKPQRPSISTDQNNEAQGTTPPSPETVIIPPSSVPTPESSSPNTDSTPDGQSTTVPCEGGTQIINGTSYGEWNCGPTNVRMMPYGSKGTIFVGRENGTFIPPTELVLESGQLRAERTYELFVGNCVISITTPGLELRKSCERR